MILLATIETNLNKFKCTDAFIDQSKTFIILDGYFFSHLIFFYQLGLAPPYVQILAPPLAGSIHIRGIDNSWGFV